MHTNLPFVKDLQNSAISITNRAYDRKVKINNLKEMANTIMYIEEHGIESRDALNNSFDESRNRTSDARSALKRSEEGIIGLNEQIHYTGQHLANKGTSLRQRTKVDSAQSMRLKSSNLRQLEDTLKNTQIMALCLLLNISNQLLGSLCL